MKTPEMTITEIYYTSLCDIYSLLNFLNTLSQLNRDNNFYAVKWKLEFLQANLGYIPKRVVAMVSKMQISDWAK